MLVPPNGVGYSKRSKLSDPPLPARLPSWECADRERRPLLAYLYRHAKAQPTQAQSSQFSRDRFGFDLALAGIASYDISDGCGATIWSRGGDTDRCGRKQRCYWLLPTGHGLFVHSSQPSPRPNYCWREIVISFSTQAAVVYARSPLIVRVPPRCAA